MNTANLSSDISVSDLSDIESDSQIVAAKPRKSIKDAFNGVEEALAQVKEAEEALEAAKLLVSEAAAEIASLTETRQFKRHGKVITLVARKNKKTGESTWFFKGQNEPKDVLEV